MTRGPLPIRFLLWLYPAKWRREYGEEMRSMLASQPLTGSVVRNVLAHTFREHLRHPAPWITGFAIVFFWRIFCFVWNPSTPLTPAAWTRLAVIDRWIILVAAFATAWVTVIREGNILRAAKSGWRAAIYGVLLSSAILLWLRTHGFVPHLQFGADGNPDPHQIGIGMYYIIEYTGATFQELVNVVGACFSGALFGHFLTRTFNLTSR
jgi:hypothetical protein